MSKSEVLSLKKRINKLDIENENLIGKMEWLKEHAEYLEDRNAKLAKCLENIKELIAEVL